MRFKRVANDAKPPVFSTSGAACCDLFAYRVFGERGSNSLPLELLPGERVVIGSGIIFEIPRGFQGEIKPKSGLAKSSGITVLNSPGTIDSDYRDEVGIILINHGKETFFVKKGEKIAQMAFSKVEVFDFEEVDDLSKTDRGGGFGWTGKL
ncbi:MAG: dUTP diphosphatase [Patescibacteria group bacterium]